MYYGLSRGNIETDGYGYYWRRMRREGWKFNKFNRTRPQHLLLVRFTDAQAAHQADGKYRKHKDYRRAHRALC